MQAIERSFPRIQETKIRDKWQQIIKNSAENFVEDRRCQTEEGFSGSKFHDDRLDHDGEPQDHTYDDEMNNRKPPTVSQFEFKPKQQKKRQGNKRALGRSQHSAAASSYYTESATSSSPGNSTVYSVAGNGTTQNHRAGHGRNVKKHQSGGRGGGQNNGPMNYGAGGMRFQQE